MDEKRRRGRPSKGDDEKRPTLNARVAPETLRELKARSEDHNISVGEAIDDAVKRSR